MKSQALLLLIFSTLVYLFASNTIAAETAATPEASTAKNTKHTSPEAVKQKLEATVLNQNLTLEKRIKALKNLLSDQMTSGKLPRTFCIWDPLGNNGPVAAAAKDQVLRSLHYGMQLSIEVFQDEENLVDKFITGDTCDAMLVRGTTAHRFNAFLATTEAPGALPDRQHLQLLSQLLTRPQLIEYMTDGPYVALGLVPVGSHYLYAESADLASVKAIQGNSVSVPASDTGVIRLIESAGGRARPGVLPAAVQTFTDNLSSMMIAPEIAYLTMATGRTGKNTRALKLPIAQSTLQLIGRTDRFPPGLAQILREDFLFKFNSYAQRLEQEQNNIPAQFWINPTTTDLKALEEFSQKIRIAMREEGYYNPVMLRLARKIRCRFNPDKKECSAQLE